jgi:hypothetical protein
MKTKSQSSSAGKLAKNEVKTNNGWKTCSRGHKFRGDGPCPICWPNKAKA